MSRKSLVIKLIVISILLSSCFRQISEDQKVNIQGNPNIEQFQNYLNTQASNALNEVTLAQAQINLNALPPEQQEQALDYLTYKIEQVGTEEAKRQYKLNPELKMSEVIAAIPSEQVPDWSRKLFETNPVFNVKEFKALDSQQQKSMLEMLGIALEYYSHLASATRSGQNYATENMHDISNFLEQVQRKTPGS